MLVCRSINKRSDSQNTVYLHVSRLFLFCLFPFPEYINRWGCSGSLRYCWQNRYIVRNPCLVNSRWFFLILTSRLYDFILFLPLFLEETTHIPWRSCPPYQTWVREKTHTHWLVYEVTWIARSRSSRYFENRWAFVGGLSLVNAIVTHLCDLINTGLVRWRMTVIMWKLLRKRGRGIESRK